MNERLQSGLVLVKKYITFKKGKGFKNKIIIIFAIFLPFLSNQVKIWFIYWSSLIDLKSTMAWISFGENPRRPWRSQTNR